MATVRGGLMRVVETLAAEQARRDEVVVVSPLAPRALSAGATVRWRELRLRGNGDCAGLLRLRGILADESPDVAVVHAGSPGELAAAAAFATRRCATAVLEHAPHHYPLRRPLRDVVLVSCKRRARRWLSVSAAGARHLESLWHLAPGTIGVLHSGVLPPSSGETDNSLDGVVLGCGRPVVEKGYDTFRTVAGQLAGGGGAPRFVWIGAERAGRDGAVELLPWREDLAPALSACRLVLLPSRVEGVPLTMLEAWAAGAPVVASAIGGIPEVMRDGVDGVVAAAGDVAAWVRVVGAVLGDEDTRRRLAEAGRTRWREEFTTVAMGARWEAVFAELEVGP